MLATKQKEGLPVFVPEREAAKVAAFREAAGRAGLDPDCPRFARIDLRIALFPPRPWPIGSLQYGTRREER